MKGRCCCNDRLLRPAVSHMPTVACMQNGWLQTSSGHPIKTFGGPLWVDESQSPILDVRPVLGIRSFEQQLILR